MLVPGEPSGKVGKAHEPARCQDAERLRADNFHLARRALVKWAKAHEPTLNEARGKLAVRRTALEAVAAINRLIATRLEWHFGHAAALAAGRAEHFALATAAATAESAAATAATASAAARSLTRSAAIGATVGLVLKALHGEKLLFAG